jgi:Ice-binding-like
MYLPRANLRDPSARSSTSIALVLLSFAASACGGADQPQTRAANANPASTLASKGTASPASTPPLGSAANFAILGGPAATCTDSSVTGAIGTGLPGSAVTQTNCPITGTVHKADAIAAQAYNDFLLASIALGNVACPTDPAHNLTGTLASVTLTPGVYCFAAAAALTGTLTLDGQGNANASWTFKVAGDAAVHAGLTATNFSVVMANGALPCNVTWWVNAAATLTSSNMVGSILAGADITFTGVGSFLGRALSKGAVTVTSLSSFGSCAGAVGGVGGVGGGCSTSGDRITGGGYISLPSGSKGTFAVSGGNNESGFRGELEYDDHGARGIDVKGMGVTQYLVVNAVTRHIVGTATVNHVAGFTYQVDVSDNGEHRNDTFGLTVYSSAGEKVYSASSTLKDGDIQLHKSHGDDCDDDDNGDDHDGDHKGDDHKGGDDKGNDHD